MLGVEPGKGTNGVRIVVRDSPSPIPDGLNGTNGVSGACFEIIYREFVCIGWEKKGGETKEKS